MVVTLTTKLKGEIVKAHKLYLLKEIVMLSKLVFYF